MKNKTKKTTLATLSVALLAGAVVPSIAVDSQRAYANSEYTWTIEGNQATIVSYLGASKDVVIPDQLDGKPVTKIGERAFYNKKLTSVVIPDSVKSIGQSAFSSNLLTEIVLREGLVELGESVFYSNNIYEATLPSSLKIIPRMAFERNKITSIIIPEGVTHLDYSAFGNNLIEKVELPSTLVAVGHAAFSENKLTDITLPENLKIIDMSAFSNNLLESVSVPNSVKEIGSSAFRSNKIKSIVLPDTLTTIKEQAFENNQIEEISLPTELTFIGAGAFGGNKLQEVVLPTKLVTIGGGSWFGYLGAFEKNNINKVVLNEKLEFIGSSAFAQNKIEEVVLPNSVKTVGYGAFEKNNIEQITIPENVETLGYGAFTDNLLKTVTVPASLKKVESSAFSNNLIETVVIEEGLTSIPSYLFNNNLIKSVTLPNSLESVDSYAFSNNKIEKVTFPEGLTNINSDAFRNNLLTTVELPESLITIGNSAFNTNKLTEVILPNKVVNIGESVFYRNEIRRVTLSENTKSIGSSAFFGNKIVEVILPNTVTSVGDNAFSSNQIQNLRLSNNLKEIGRSAFSNNKIEAVDFPDSIQSIRERAFFSNEIKKLTLPNTILSIEKEAFSFNKIESLKISEGLKTLESDVFSNNNLKTVAIPSSLEIIKDYAFKNNLFTKVSIPSSIKAIGYSAFSGPTMEQGKIEGKSTILTSYSNNPFSNTIVNTPTMILHKDSVIAKNLSKSIQYQSVEELDEVRALVLQAEESQTKEDLEVARQFADQLVLRSARIEYLNRLQSITDEVNYTVMQRQIVDHKTAIVKGDLKAGQVNGIIDQLNDIIETASRFVSSLHKTELTKQANDIKDQLQGFDLAVLAIERAEQSGTPSDVRIAKDYMNRIQASSLKRGLNERFERLYKVIEVLEAAEKAVEKAEEYPTVYNIQSAESSVYQVLSKEEKARLTVRIEAVRNKILVQNAEKLMESAEKYKRDPYIAKAQEAVNQVFEPERSVLQGRLDLILAIVEKEQESDKKNKEDIAAGKALTKIEQAERYERDPYLTDAQILVNSVPLGEKRNTLQARLDKLVNGLAGGDFGDVVPAETLKAIEAAKTKVEQAEKYKRDPYLSQATHLVVALPEIPQKAELQARLDAIGVNAPPVNTSAGDTLAVGKATMKVEQAEKYQRDPYLTDARLLVDTLPASDEKTALQARLNTLLAPPSNNGVLDAEHLRQVQQSIMKVEQAERYKRDPYLSQATQLVAGLQDSKEKSELQARLDVLGIVDTVEPTGNTLDAVLKATTKVEQAEKYKRDPYLTQAAGLVGALADSVEKDALQARLDALGATDVQDGLTQADLLAISKASTKVEQAEKYKRDPYLTQATSMVAALVESEEKDALQARLNALIK